MNMKKNENHGFSWKLLKRAVKYLAKDAPGIFPMTLLVAGMNAVYPYIGIFLSADILTQLADPERDMDRLVFLAMLLVGLNFFGKRLIDFCAQVLEVMKYTAMKHIVRSVAEKAWKMDYAMSADPKVNETKERITHWFYRRGVMALSRLLQNIFSACVTIAISIALVVEFFGAKAVESGGLSRFLNHWSSAALFWVLLLFSVGYNIYASARQHAVFREADEESSRPLNQAQNLVGACIAKYSNGKDIRMFQAQGLINDRVHSLMQRYEQIYNRTEKKGMKIIFPAEIVSRLFNLLVYVFVGIKAVCGAFGVGSILKYTGMVTQMGDGIYQLCDNIRYFIQNFRNINIYFDYLDMPNATVEGTLPVTDEIRNNYEFEFRNVTFTYPNAAVPSLSGINCRFRKGEKIAIVGRNGSGKTTFIKLLCRLCDPDEGEILLNGVDIRQYRYEEYLSLFSTVFQDYCVFAFKLGENVAAESDYDREKATEALENAGYGERLKTLAKGLDTQLFNRFSEEGVELSGGESQKVAIARCLYKDAPYVVLDEPTSALDPVAEADIYQRMNRFALDKGAVYISHRLSSCYFCDRIFVFEEGRIAQQGGHEELLAEEGLYRKLWDAQAKYYT